MVRKALKRHALSTLGTRTNVFTALKAYANTFAITNIQKLGYAGLSHTYYQKSRLKEFVNTNKSMKLLVDVFVEFKHLEDKDKDFVDSIRSRRYNILNQEDLNNSINKMATDIEISVENKNF